VANSLQDLIIELKNAMLEGSGSQIYYHCVLHWSFIRLLPKNYYYFLCDTPKKYTIPFVAFARTKILTALPD